MPAETMTQVDPSQAAEGPDWKGTARYEVLRCIGRGGMGLVYEAFDRERQQHVALKTLLNSSPGALYLFKQEFRTLADVHHRNLVQLYELVVTDDDRVFFTMELVHGTDFLTYVQKAGWRGPSEAGPEPTDQEPTRREQPATASGERMRLVRAPREDTPSTKTCPADVPRLRNALCQLVDGVRALHAAGKLHRDIKPSNVRVTPEGRVVLLDFGVATELSRVGDENLAEGGEMVGTARYMAPEQAVNEGPTAASDWYSVGVMLYEALVGSPPFTGSTFDVLKMKSMLEPPPPSDCIEGVPHDLDALCAGLLLRASELRPAGAEILHQLGMRTSVPVSAPPPPGDAALPIVGREAPLRALQDAFASARAGRTITVMVGGPSGMGKSTIVQHFLDGLVERGEAVVLRGRAYERESVPYKAIDSVVDALSRYLMRLSDREDSLTVPRDVWALARLFPVLRRIPSIANLEPQLAGDPNRMRRRAFSALRELLWSLSRRQPLVVFVDGVQWGDADSAALLRDIVRPPDAPPLLLVLTYRAEDAETSPFLLEIRKGWPALAELRHLTVGPLDEPDTRRLALTLLGSDDLRAQRTADAITLEASGSPFLVDELARSVSGPHSVARSEDTSPGILTVSLEQMVKARLARLPERELRLLRIVAVAGRPLPVSVAADAAGVHDAVDEAVSLMRARRFVRTGIRDGRETVEMIHDRIREMIVAKISPRLVREYHRQLARVLEASPDPDSEAIAMHLIGAGEPARAAQHAERAAERAAAQLAFDRAVSLYRLTLESLPKEAPDFHRLRLRLAETLEWSGRGAEAARVYLEEARDRPESERIELERAAAEQLLTSGRIDEGAGVLRRVLADLGMGAPRSALGALCSLLFYRFLLLFVGLRFEGRPAGRVRPEDRVRIDTLYSAAMGFVLVDVVLGACMQTRHLFYALRRGDNFQVLRAACLEANNLASAGGKQGRRELALHTLGERLAQRSDNLEEQLFVDGTRGTALFLRGRFKEARDTLEAVSEQYMMQRRAGWQSNAFLFAIDALLVLGDLREAVSLKDRLYVDAEQRGDLYTTVNIATRASAFLAMAADEIDEARRHVREAMAQWSRAGFLVQHWQAMQYEAEIELYVGDGGRGYARLVRDERALRRSFLTNVQVIRSLTWFLRGRCAIASIPSDASLRAARIEEARRLAGKLARERTDWSGVFAKLLRAAIANAENDRPETIAALRASLTGALEADLFLHAAAARYQLGTVLPGEAGREMLEQATQEMTSRGIRSPSRMADRLLPGRWGRT
ncbi:MAG TPA: AAA family ATPase [Polyangiaceae bacterium]|nr:AAA family ATPase [Polyangiaceae bacterium]